VPKGDKGFGMTYEVSMNLTGLNGKTAWVDDMAKKEMRLVTVFVDK